MHRCLLLLAAAAACFAAAVAMGPPAEAAEPEPDTPPCVQRPAPGPCKASITRYYWDTTTRECTSFIWGGCKGSVPFESLADCQAAKCDAQRCSFPGIPGPCEALVYRYFYDKKKEKCQRFLWGGCDGVAPFTSRAQCVDKCEPPQSPCDKRPAGGMCLAFFTRYYYDKKTATCKKFTWGGCGGSVPFTTKQACTRACELPEACTQKPDKGPCRARKPRFFYDAASRSCKRFFWGGCKGVVPFDTRGDCEKLCPVSQCARKPDAGPCAALFERYYYDAEAGQCKRFFYGGCKGVVPFLTRAACKEECEA